MGSAPSTAAASWASHGRELLAAALAARELAGPSSEQGEVARADRPARPGEQGEQRGVGGDVLDERERGDHLGHLRQPEQPLETDDLHGDLAAAQGVEDGRGVRVVAGEDADLPPRRDLHRRPGLDHLVGQPDELVVVGLVDGGADLAGRRTRLRLQRQQLGPRGVEVGGQVVGRGQDALVGAAVDGERIGRGAAAAGREVLAELQDVGDRRTAPAVDRLVGVADRRDRVAEPGAVVGAREEPAQHQRLRHRGVLVLVEQDDLVLVALDGTDLGALLGEPGGERDLVGEVHQPEVVLEPAVGLDELEELGAPVDREDRLLVALAVGLARLGRHAGLEERPLGGVEGAQPVGVDEVLAQLGVEREEVLDDVGG